MLSLMCVLATTFCVFVDAHSEVLFCGRFVTRDYQHHASSRENVAISFHHATYMYVREDIVQYITVTCGTRTHAQARRDPLRHALEHRPSD